jgi:transposase
MPVVPRYIIEPIWEQFRALLPERDVDHPLGCHRTRIPDRVIFEKLVQVLVFGCAYWRISDEECSATTLRRRRDEWIELGAMDALEGIVRDAYDRIVGLELEEVAVDCCIQRRLPVEVRRRAGARWIEENGASNARWLSTSGVSRSG